MAPRLFGISLAWLPAAAAPAWLILTMLMAFACIHTARRAHAGAMLDAGLIAAFIVLCWLHPLYTSVAAALGIRRLVEVAGSAATLVVLLFLLLQLRRTAPTAVLLLAPVALWLVVATYYLAQMLRMERT